MKKFEEEYESSNQIIGQGAFAQVFLAKSKRTGEKVAVKMSNRNNPISVKEKQILLQLAQHIHPNVVKILDILYQESMMLIIQEFCSGGSLYELMVQRHKFTEDEAVEIIYQVAQGLQFLHQNDIVHRDIKPENVLRQITEDGVEQFKITDFGLSSTKKDQRMMTTKVGTAYYVAPEILDYRVNFDGYDRTVDIWALGLVFDELLHGSPFYNGTSEEEVFSKIKNDHYFIRDSTYRESTIFDLRKYTIKQVLINTVARDPAKRKDLKWILQQLDDAKIVTQPGFQQQEQKFQTNYLTGISQTYQPNIKQQQQIPFPVTQVFQPTIVQQVDLLELPSSPKCQIHQYPYQFVVPDGDLIVQCCIKCLWRFNVYETNELDKILKQALLEFQTKGFDYYYKPSMFQKELRAVTEKYQDSAFVIIEKDSLGEKYTQLALKYAKKARIEFQDLVEQLRQGKGGLFLAASLKQQPDGLSLNCVTKEMQVRMNNHRQDALKECEILLRQQLVNLLALRLEQI